MFDGQVIFKGRMAGEPFVRMVACGITFVFREDTDWPGDPVDPRFRNHLGLKVDDLGRAILNYRKAEQFNPNDANVQQNLEYARGRRKDALGEQVDKRVLKTLLFWHYDFSFGQRFVLFSIVFVGLWIAAAARLFVRRPFLRWIIAITAGLSLVLAASLIIESLTIRNQRPGVVVAEEVTARKGDSESYEVSFQEPLHAGAEFLLVEERNKWVQVELPDGRRCWLPTRAVAMVR